MLEIDWKGWGRALLDFFLPGDCPICRRSAYRDGVSFSCLSCLDSLAWIRGSRCKFCGLGMQGMDYAGLICNNCRESEPAFCAGRSMFYLDPAGQALVHDLKYCGNKRTIGDLPFFLERAEGFSDFLSGAVLIPVPLHPKKFHQRGFNQSLWIADAFAQAVGDETVVYDCMVRIRHTKTQTKLDATQRRKNVKNAFALKRGTCLNGFERYVLVDDVCTTGATLDACASALVESGVKKVEVATLGHG